MEENHHDRVIPPTPTSVSNPFSTHLQLLLFSRGIWTTCRKEQDYMQKRIRLCVEKNRSTCSKEQDYVWKRKVCRKARQAFVHLQAHVYSVSFGNYHAYLPMHICTDVLYPSAIIFMHKRPKHCGLFLCMHLQV